MRAVPLTPAVGPGPPSPVPGRRSPIPPAPRAPPGARAAPQPQRPSPGAQTHQKEPHGSREQRPPGERRPSSGRHLGKHPAGPGQAGNPRRAGRKKETTEGLARTAGQRAGDPTPRRKIKLGNHQIRQRAGTLAHEGRKHGLRVRPDREERAAGAPGGNPAEAGVGPPSRYRSAPSEEHTGKTPNSSRKFMRPSTGSKR